MLRTVKVCLPARLLPGGVKSKQPNLSLLALLAAVQARSKDMGGKRSQKATPPHP